MCPVRVRRVRRRAGACTGRRGRRRERVGGLGGPAPASIADREGDGIGITAVHQQIAVLERGVDQAGPDVVGFTARCGCRLGRKGWWGLRRHARAGEGPGRPRNESRCGGHPNRRCPNPAVPPGRGRRRSHPNHGSEGRFVGSEGDPSPVGNCGRLSRSAEVAAAAAR